MTALITFAELTRRTARLVARMAAGAASSGSTTTLVDATGLANYPDNQFNDGTVWITGGSMTGLSRRVTGFASGSDTLTFGPALINPIQAGDTYEVADGNVVTYQDLRQAVNNAIQELGPIPDTPQAINTVANMTMYALSSLSRRVLEVWLVKDYQENNATRWPSTHWEELQGQLVFDQGYEPEAGLKMLVYFEKMPTQLANDSDFLDNEIDPTYLIFLAARQAMRLAYKRFGKTKEEIPEWLNEAINEAQAHRQRNRRPIVRVHTA